MSAPTKDLCVITFGPATSIGEVRRRVLHAFLEGYNCFLFRLEWHLKSGKKRVFEDRVGLNPRTADEAEALEMAEWQFSRFANTIGKLAIGKL